MKKHSLLALILIAHAGSAMAADPILEPSMASIPAGSFAMGSPTTLAKGDYPVEQPVHQVNIPAFQMSRYEVTVGQFSQFVEATGHTPTLAEGQPPATCWKHAANDWGMEAGAGTWKSNAYPQSPYHPVMCVSWADAKAYTAWLAEKTGKPYRLPSESEWEYAARAGSPHNYHFGADETQLCRYGNIRDTLGRDAIGKLTNKPGAEALCTDGSAFTSIVGMYEPNQFGLYDMIGNLGEIVEDCEHANYTGAPADGSAWTTNCSKDMRMHRGGSFQSRVTATSTGRGHTGATNASSFEGFRVALGMPGPATPAAGTIAFEAGLDKARAAERARR
ncbi:formylglycine-generating enzyme family protein [Massilia glaciei]|uniref:Formylglycine-generating enzyme family protein n=1 Tax=Massilia glaciei TaxID=1524097 RepID=A0A2U2HJY7_9BURK|nr:formylglycine-generating enzyme family protein [Massilia glaciei]PWF47782.1 formylglycine-generating enzyme family protein [Massilia glaciei]